MLGTALTIQFWFDYVIFSINQLQLRLSEQIESMQS